jgi:S-DNA-T family DNA segregation ATPase FtsK/SpoIIIE
MDERYTLLQAAETRNIKEYNEKFINRRLNPKNGHRFLPYIVVVIDEFADMIMTAGREIETPIARLAQLARAIGIHLVIATQRPDANIITGLIRANFPARIAFRVQSSQNSRIILDAMGAHQLIGRGDMLISVNGEITRVQCALIDTPEVERVTEFIQNQRGFEHPYYLPEWTPDAADGGAVDFDVNLRDAMFERAAQIVVGAQQGSTSLLQRKLSVGHARAGRLMDQLEASGIVGPSEGSKPRQVYFQDITSLEAHLNNLAL